MKNVKSHYLPRYTYEDYLHWEGSWELIDGIAYAKSPASDISHQECSNLIAVQLGQILEKCKKFKAVLPIDWKIDEDTVLQPDNLVIHREAQGKYLREAPIIIFEILSPSSSYKDKVIKFEIYESQRVKYYIIVDVVAKIAEVFELVDDQYQKKIDAQTDIVTFALGECDVDFDFGRIWG